MPAKKWYLSKTIWANVIALAIALLIAIGGAIQANSGQVDWNTIYVAALAVLNIVLRFVTNQPISPAITELPPTPKGS